MKLRSLKFGVSSLFVLLVLALLIFSSLVIAGSGHSLTGSGASGDDESNQLSCRDSDSCREIDDIWASLLSSPGFTSLNGNKDLIWNPYDGESTIGEWVEYNDKYPEQVTTTPITATIVSAGSLGSCDNLEIDYSLVDVAFSTSTLDSSFESNLKSMANRLDVNYVHLLAVMKFESSLDPASVNDRAYDGHPEGTQATGLIQFLPSVAQSHETTVEALREMTASEQLVYVEKYYEGGITRSGFRGDNLGDVAMVVISPVTVGKSDDKVMYSKGSSAYEANDALDIDGNGEITRGEYVTFVINSAGFYNCAVGSSSSTSSSSTTSTTISSEHGKKVVVIGASNSVSSSYVDNLETLAPSYTFINSGHSGDAPSVMLARFQTDVLDHDPDIVIIEPSINGMTSSSYTSSVISMAQQAKSSGAIVVVLSNSPHKWFNYCGTLTGDTQEERWASRDCSGKWDEENWQASIDSFNNDLLNNKLGIPSDIDYVVDIYDILEDVDNPDVCSDCATDGGHFTQVADGLVSSKVYYDVFHNLT